VREGRVCSGMATEVGVSKARDICAAAALLLVIQRVCKCRTLVHIPPPVPHPFVGIFSLDLSSLSLV
jgi:hypothetical protein